MADDDQQPPPKRFWFPWTSPPEPPPPAPRPGLRPQLSRRDTRPAPPPSSAAAPSPSRRQPHPQPASRGAGAGSPQAQPQPTRLSSRPSPARAPPLSPVREPNTSAAPVAKEIKPATPPPHPTAQVPTQKDIIIIPQEKIIHEPTAHSKTHSKAVEKEKEKEKKDKDRDKEKEKDKKEKDKGKEKDKDMEKEKEKKEKDKGKEKEKEHKEKEKEHKEREKEKAKEHKEKREKEKEEIKSKEAVSRHDVHDESTKVHGGKLHKELKAGVADMLHKLGASAPSSGHERPAGAPGTTVITLAGENKGASMKISHAEAESKERRARKLDEGKQEAHGGAKGLTASVNSNVQVINNSLLLQSSCHSSDPGVHLKLSTKSKKKGDGEDAGGKGGSAATSKK